MTKITCYTLTRKTEVVAKGKLLGRVGHKARGPETLKVGQPAANDTS